MLLRRGASGRLGAGYGDSTLARRRARRGSAAARSRARPSAAPGPAEQPPLGFVESPPELDAPELDAPELDAPELEPPLGGVQVAGLVSVGRLLNPLALAVTL